MLTVTERDGRISFSVKIVPRASSNEIAGIQEGVLRIRLTAPPVEGAANKALVSLLADILEVPKREVIIVSGHRRRQKVVAVSGLTSEIVRSRLCVHL